MSRGRIFVAVAAVAAGIGWVAAQGLSSSLVYYKTTTELLREGPSAVGDRVRLGGFVEPGSVVQQGPSTLRFVVSDGATSMTVVSSSGVPSLFRGGRGVVVEGTLGRDGAFHADTVLVRHSDVYRPPAPGETPTTANLEEG
ncbi:MAG: cytochrome c maturation protein CcmE [Actinomycetota bacterium]